MDGYHSLVRHNPFTDELLMGGGNHNPRILARLTKAGKIDRLRDLPVPFSVSGDKFTVDPQTGRYLLLSATGDGPMQAFEFDSDANEYRTADAIAKYWPYGRYAMPGWWRFHPRVRRSHVGGTDGRLPLQARRLERRTVETGRPGLSTVVAGGVDGGKNSEGGRAATGIEIAVRNLGGVHSRVCSLRRSQRLCASASKLR